MTPTRWLLAVLAVAVVLVAVLIGVPPNGGSPKPSPTTAAASTSAVSVGPVGGPSFGPYPTGQPGHPQLGGTGWSILDVDGESVVLEPQLHFWGGRGQGEANGEAESMCYFIAFDYSYAPTGSGLAFRVRSERDGSYTEGCKPAEQAEYARIVNALGRVTYWTMLEPDRLGLLGAQNKVMIAAGPPPPLPTAPPGGDCGEVPVEPCMEAAAATFRSGLFLVGGQRIVSWRVRPTVYTACASGFEPVYDVIYALENPAFEKIATVGEVYGRLVACGDY